MATVVERRRLKLGAETCMASLDNKSKIEILLKEVELERSWRIACQGNLNSLIKRIPVYSVEKKSTTKEKLPAANNSTTKLKEGDEIKRIEEMNEKSPALSDFSEEANKEIERLKHLCSTLSEKNNILTRSHESELAVYKEFRNWVESENFGQRIRFREFKSEDIEQLLTGQVAIGSGGFGNVYKVVLGGEFVAVKILRDSGTQGSREFHTEVELLKKIHHSNIVHLIGACLDREALIYEYLENGTLEDALHKKPAWFTWKARINVALNICSAPIFLHSIRPMPVVHGDLKPENIMFNAHNIPKISDFGISHELKCTTNTGTWEHLTTGMPRGSSSYVDPEFRDTGKLTPFADVYAFGVVLLQLVTGERSLGLIDFVQKKLTDIAKPEEQGRKTTEENIDENRIDG